MKKPIHRLHCVYGKRRKTRLFWFIQSSVLLDKCQCIQFKWHTVPHWFSRILMKCALLIRIDSGRPANFLCFSFCSALQIHDFKWTRTEWTVESLQNYFYRRWRRKKTPREIQLCKKLSARNKRKRSIKTLCTVVVHKCLVCELSTYTQHLKWKTIRIREKRIILLTKFWLVEHPNR